MLLTDDELKLIRLNIEAQTGIDRQLIERCSHLIHVNAFDEAVSKAFVVLEERLRKFLKKDGMSGMPMVQYAFSKDGPLTKMLGDNPSELEGMQGLLTGAFKLYRNPAAHTFVGYDQVEARDVVHLVDLILKRLDRLSAIPLPGSLPKNVEAILSLVESKHGSKAVGLLRQFLSNCVGSGLEVRSSTNQWIPFRRQAMLLRDGWDKPKSHLLTVFYVYTNTKDQGLWYPVNLYYKNAIHLNTDEIKKQLRSLGFQVHGRSQDYFAVADATKSKSFYDELLALTQKILKDLDTQPG